MCPMNAGLPPPAARSGCAGRRPRGVLQPVGNHSTSRGTPLTKQYLLLFAAIVAEVIATTSLARSESLSRFWPTVITVVGYALAFWFLSYPIRVMPTGVVYAIWSGMGIVLISSVAWLWYGQTLDLPALLGLALILLGVIIVNVFSKTVGH